MYGNNYDNIFDRACLLQLQVRMWQGQKTMEPSVMAQLGDADWLKGRKYLVDPEHLSGLKLVASRARCMLKKQALPFPLDGLTLVPKEAIPQIEANLQEYQEQFWHALNGFVARYQKCREEAQAVLGELFSETDYPMDIRGRFSFQWRYVQLALPGQSRVLSPELYEREQRKFLDLMETARADAVVALRQEFAGLVSHMAERLTPAANGDKPKVLRTSMVEKLEEFLSDFQTRNLFRDDNLEDLVEQTKQMLRGVDVNALRSNEALKKQVHCDMEQLKESIDASLEELPRRRILLAA